MKPGRSPCSSSSPANLGGSLRRSVKPILDLSAEVQRKETACCYRLPVVEVRWLEDHMNDADRIDALLDLIDPERNPAEGKGAKLAVYGLAKPGLKGRYRPTVAGWSLLGEKGRAFRTNDE